MKIFGIDIGYGDTKVVCGTESEIINVFKFPSVIGDVKLNTMVQDNRILPFEGHNYYVGTDALHLESAKIRDVTTYPTLEQFSPLFLSHCIRVLGERPDRIVAGLSIAQIEHSGHYRQRLKTALAAMYPDGGDKISVRVLPQGIGAKVAFDKYGDRFPEGTKDFVDSATYIGADVGFNTLDIFQVLNGKASPNTIRGIEGKGLMTIVMKLITHIKDVHKVNFSLKEGKDILDTGFFKHRGKPYDMREAIKDLKNAYLAELEDLVEQQFGKVLDKSDYMLIFGGGSYLFFEYADAFRRVPKQRAEYYNAIGYYLWGLNKPSE